MPPTQYRPSRRNWIKLWTHEWLTGTVRWQLSTEQRSMWADLLALAGDSRFPGIVTPGEDAGKFIGYPASYFVGLFRCSAEKVTEAFEIFEQQNRIRVGDGGEIHIVNWDKYQSEYQEKRQRKQYKRNSAQVTTNVRKNSARLESEVEVEGDVEVDVKSSRIDDLKESYLEKCNDPQGMVRAIVEIVCERAAKSGVKIRTEAYLQKAVESFDVHGGQDKEELQRRLILRP